ncbi:hypothetical protein Tco_1271635 [Tanacetum coccineum]
MYGEEPASQKAPIESPQMVSTVKLPILKKGEYTLWSTRIEYYLTNTDYALWQVILNGDGPIQVTKDENGVEIEVPLKTAQALLARQRERKAKSILLLAIPDEYQLRFHAIKDAKTLWAAIKSRFGGNVESKKMQKNVLKQQFENFFVSDTEGLDKAYDMFQKLISLLEVHGAAVSNEDENQKFLRALPLSWNNIALIMRNKEGIDELDIDDLYNNLKVFEADIKGSFKSSSNSQNVAFLSAEDTSSSNEVNTANDFDEQDLVYLYRLVVERSASRTLEGYDLILLGDLKTMFEPSEDDDIWRNQQDWSLISWKLYETYEVHTLLMDEGKVLYKFPRFISGFVTKHATGRMIEGVPCGLIDMVKKDLDLEPKIDAMMRDFLK